MAPPASVAELRKEYNDIDWQLVFTLVQDYLATGGQIDPAFKTHVKAEVGPVKWELLEDLIRHPERCSQLLAQLGPRMHSQVKELAHHHTPLNRFVFRNTRTLLREYQRRGILRENVPYRKPELKRVPMRADEKALYTRIEDYISHFYQKYENERRGLGFVMTVYRRRLTSSFYAVRKSLERRGQWLRGLISAENAVGDDDVEQEELDQDISETTAGDTNDRERFKDELEYVDDFIQELRALSAADSKLEWLKAELNTVFMQRPTALVFTQYTDTMDYLRDQLVEVYGSHVACYSGRGGEVWNGIAWALTTKEAVKNSFAAGDVSVMLCTESASEGLNLQTCGVLINYDMPWNPMRVEQRIGRIGQKYKTVWASNYFYQDTIEDQIYQRLADRIDWFEVVVGDLQPILAEVGEVTRRLAMLPANERETQLEQEIAALRKRLQNKEVESLNLDAYANTADDEAGSTSPVVMADLEDLLAHSQATGYLFTPDPDIPEAYLLTWQNTSYHVTFSRTCFDQHISTVRFLSYGSELLAQLLSGVLPPDEAEGASPVMRYASEAGMPLRQWYAANGAGIQSINSLSQLKQVIADSTQPAATLSAELRNQAAAWFEQEVKAAQERHAEVMRFRLAARQHAQRVKAQRILIKAALVEIALGQQPGLFDSAAYPAAFSEQAVRGLQRHGYPWGALLQLSCVPDLAPDPDDAYYQEIAGASSEQLKGRFNQLKDEARKMVLAIKAG